MAMLPSDGSSLPPPERGRVGVGVNLANGPPPGTLRSASALLSVPTSPFQGEVKEEIACR
jgi:hypothetical protein